MIKQNCIKCSTKTPAMYDTVHCIQHGIELLPTHEQAKVINEILSH